MTQIDLKTVDIFCRVIDNYGDIGVCWRLARQLANEYPFQVRLWVDELEALIKIWPEADKADQYKPQRSLQNLEICLWQHEFDAALEPADLVIEAFACDLPESYITSMKQRPTPPCWFNLEYLCAEDWVEGCHGLASIHPQLGLKKIFYFPGVTAKTGGLLKEASLLAERDKFLTETSARDEFLKTLAVELPENALLLSLFGYENTAIATLIDAWVNSPTPIICLVPHSKILPSINHYLKQSLDIGDEFVQGSLCIKVIPFLTQTDYDKLLWACDINFIRGEDSFVRAQWAAKPFIWHIYPQEEDYHLVKLDAFLQHYLQDLSPQLQDSIRTLWQQWNQGLDCAESWQNCLNQRQKWQNHSQNWCNHLNSLGDLASNMVQFCQKTL